MWVLTKGKSNSLGGGRRRRRSGNTLSCTYRDSSHTTDHLCTVHGIFSKLACASAICIPHPYLTCFSPFLTLPKEPLRSRLFFFGIPGVCRLQRRSRKKAITIKPPAILQRFPHGTPRPPYTTAPVPIQPVRKEHGALPKKNAFFLGHTHVTTTTTQDGHIFSQPSL